MRDIELKMNRRELELLVKLVYIGSFVTETEPDDETEQSEALLERILQLAKAFDVIPDITYDHASNKHDLSQEKEEEILADYEDFVDFTFWEELVGRLAQRDFRERHTQEEIDAMDPADRLGFILEAEKPYAEAFETKGLERLRLKRG